MEALILADTGLARRIDDFEARGSRTIGEVTIRNRPELGAFVMPLGKGVAVYTGPCSPANKIIGAGFDNGIEDAALDDIESAYFERGSDIQAEVATLARPDAHALFTSRGYILQGFENVLGRTLGHEDGRPAEDTGFGIEKASPTALDSWIDVLITGFEHPDASGAGSGVALPPRNAIEDAFRQFSETPGFHAYLVTEGEMPAGGGGLRIDCGIAQLCGASTLPSYRRRGIQSALLRRRLCEAYHAGCDFAVMTAQPGSKSHFNAQRQGFSLLYSRAILVKSCPCR